MESYGIFGLALLLLGVVQGYPQFGSPDDQNAWSLGQQQNPWMRPQSQTPSVPDASTSTTTTTAPPTTPSPEYLQCLQTCPATSEYNPICGSDNINYYNQNKFNCAQRCGLRILRVHQGICRT